MQNITAQQILVPKKVYIGDTAELRCSFNSPDAALKTLTQNGSTELPNEIAASPYYDIKSIKLSPAGVDYYQISITFIPWKTGEILFPPLVIDNTELTLEFQPLQIVSLIGAEGNAGAASLRDSAAPLLLPGTTYKLYGSLTLFIILMIITIRIIIKRKSLAFYFNTKKLQRKYKKNKKQTIKSLKKLLSEYESKKTSEDLAAEKTQHILRNYLEVRFDYPFTKAASSEIMPGFYKATGGLLSSRKEESFGEIASGFIRTDYIRYKNKAHFNEDEFKALVKNFISSIEILENEEEKKEEEKNA